ncbi:MAG: hypothetical protein A2Y62_02040 [Candidatus Fischerbacteria bacterium RBG_13_37_8]|uniref:Esterase n=1 Tax=Candidatus Fischerbacteria bacterium RBG_13_37_8 TaxID=1817863 RepID=A0A1F5VJY4_9BACT|nr:MAG: hypothetical protein A2Y62_02040 [Candidatus Fischerbacteria bacterium RBG_13_37_8]
MIMTKILQFLLMAMIMAELLTCYAHTDKQVVHGTILHNKIERTYIMYLPAPYDHTKFAPLIFALHGGGGTAEGMVKLTAGSFNRLADKEGFIIVYPQGVGRHWNDGRKGANDRAHKENIDDVGFISLLIDRLVTEWNINPARIYVTGISNGAGMSFMLACHLSKKITAIAPVALTMSEDMISLCSPKKSMPVAMIMGEKDPLVPWEGGEIRIGPIKRGKVISAQDSVQYWISHNKCSPKPKISYLQDKDPSDETRIRQETYSECSANSNVIFYAVEGAGHTWPGGMQYLPKWIIGKTSYDIDAAELIWDFFKQHASN